MPVNKKLVNEHIKLLLEKVNPNDTVSMTKKEFIEEHVHLVNVLRNGSKKEREHEADEQDGELSEHTDIEKAVLTHFYEQDIDRIQKLQRDTPIVENMMNLLCKHNTIIPINVDDVFAKGRKTFEDGKMRINNGVSQKWVKSKKRWVNHDDRQYSLDFDSPPTPHEIRLSKLKNIVNQSESQYGEDSNEYKVAKQDYDDELYYNTAPSINEPTNQVKKETIKFNRYSDNQLFEFADFVLSKACVYKGDTYSGENTKSDTHFIQFKKRFEKELSSSLYYKSRKIEYDSFSDNDLHRIYGICRKQLLKTKQGK